MIHVAHITTGGLMGGAERLLVDVIDAGRELGAFEAHVYVLGSGSDLGRALRSREVDCVALGARGAAGLVRAIGRLATDLRRTQPDIVHTHLLHGSAVGLLAARIAGTRPALMTRHYERFVQLYGGPAERVLHWSGHVLADHVIAISRAAAAVLVRDDRVAPTRVTIVHNGVSLDRIERDAAAGPFPAWIGGGPVIGSVGSLHPRKGHDDLIRAFARLRDHARLVLVGDGPMRAKLERLAVQLGVAGRVTFAGYEPRPYAILRAMDVYVQPSREEGFGIAVLEAMALGRPVVVTRAGGLPEIVRDGVSGLLVPPADPIALSAALERLLGRVDTRLELGARGREHVARVFSARETASGYANVYTRLLGSRSATINA